MNQTTKSNICYIQWCIRIDVTASYVYAIIIYQIRGNYQTVFTYHDYDVFKFISSSHRRLHKCLSIFFFHFLLLSLSMVERKSSHFFFLSKFILSSIITAVIINGFKMNLRIFTSFLFFVRFFQSWSIWRLFTGYIISPLLQGQFGICFVWILWANCLFFNLYF